MLHDPAPAEQGSLTTPQQKGQAQPLPNQPQAVLTFGHPAPLSYETPSYKAPKAPSVDAFGRFEPLTVEPSFTLPPAKVALLVPLSGRNAELGQAMVNAAQLAVFDIAPEGFELLPRDTGVSTVQAVQAVKDALAAGANFVIGPLFAANVAAVKPVVEAASINMVSLSTDVTLAAPNAYVMGFAPAPQVERIVSYAVARGYRQFAALVPSNPYGELVANTFKEALAKHGVNLIAVEQESNLAYLTAQKGSIECLLLPFGGSQLKAVVDQLQKDGFQHGKIQLLGTGLWDSENLGETIPFLRGGWYATAEPEMRERFTETYTSSYGRTPPRLATLAYDATALAAILTKTRARVFFRSSNNTHRLCRIRRTLSLES
jgi:ABC-type branched-subunit amino acid transport system substrate-binding protein